MTTIFMKTIFRRSPGLFFNDDLIFEVFFSQFMIRQKQKSSILGLWQQPLQL
jgi:hypothetical protein